MTSMMGLTTRVWSCRRGEGQMGSSLLRQVLNVIGLFFFHLLKVFTGYFLLLYKDVTKSLNTHIYPLGDTFYFSGFDLVSIYFYTVD